MINIFPIDNETLLCLMSCYKMLWIFIIIIFRSRTIDETFIIFMLAFDVSVYLSSSKSLVKSKRNKSRSFFKHDFWWLSKCFIADNFHYHHHSWINHFLKIVCLVPDETLIIPGLEVNRFVIKITQLVKFYNIISWA